MREMVFGIVLDKGVAMTLDAVPNGGFAWVTATIGFHENAKGGERVREGFAEGMARGN